MPDARCQMPDACQMPDTIDIPDSAYSVRCAFAHLQLDFWLPGRKKRILTEPQLIFQFFGVSSRFIWICHTFQIRTLAPRHSSRRHARGAWCMPVP